MPWTRNRAEHRAWTLAWALVGAIYLSLYPLQFVLDALRERGLLRATLAVAFALAVAAVWLWFARRRPGFAEALVLLLAGALYFVIGARLPVLQERFHLLQYGLVALAFRAAVVARRAVSPAPGRRAELAAALAAAVLTAATGWVDELIQGALPNRYYDLRDVLLNAGSGALALATRLALDALRPPS
jgi:hypothetical protein